MKVTIKFFARLREIVGSDTINRTLASQTDIKHLAALLQTEYPDLSDYLPRTTVALNHEFVSMETVLSEGDEVAFFLPVSGGTGRTASRLALSRKPISLDEVAAKVIKPETGAVAVFGGVVRNNSAGKAVDFLEYEAYEAMALKKLQQVANEARQNWPNIVDIAIVQRVGHLEVGENAVIVAVSSPHRGDGCFEACRFAIDRLKQIVPIWKKEVSPDGAEWIEGNYQPSAKDSHDG